MRAPGSLLRISSREVGTRTKYLDLIKLEDYSRFEKMSGNVQVDFINIVEFKWF